MRRFFLCAGLALIATPAAAVTVTYDLTNPGTGQRVRSVDFGAQGAPLTVTGYGYDVAEDDRVGALVGWWPAGLGLRHDASDGSDWTEGAGLLDVIVFDFGQTATLKSVTFSYADESDQFLLTLDDVFIGVGDVGGTAPDGAQQPTDLATFTFSDTYAGQLIGIGATDADDSFKLTSITVDVPADAGPAATPVPLPAAGLLMLGALGALGLRRRG